MAHHQNFNYGKLLGIYFYNIVDKSKTAIWTISYIRVQDGATCFSFLPVTLAQTEWSLIPEKTINMKPFDFNVEFMLWELNVRLKQPLLKKLYLLHDTILVFHIVTNILVDVYSPQQTISNALSSTHLNGAFLCVQGVQTFFVADNPHKITQENGYFYQQMTNKMSVSDISIFLKTKHGLYTYDSSTNVKHAKKSRMDCLQITDIFQLEEILLPLDTGSIKLGLPSCQFHFMWVNPESFWNGCLSEFFRALYWQLYKTFQGVHPMLGYIFPTASPAPTFFKPEFLGFPFINLNYGAPKKMDLKSFKCYERGNILIHWKKEISDETKDFLLACDFILPELSFETAVMWPLWTVELNLAYCSDTDDKIFISDPHTLIKISFFRWITAALFSREISLPLFREVITLGSAVIKKKVSDLYALLIASIMNWGKKHSIGWLAISGCSVVLQSPHRVEVSETSKIKIALRDSFLYASASPKASPDPDLLDLTVEDRQSSVFILWNSTILYSSGTVDQLQSLSSWMQCLPVCLSLVINTEYKTPIDVLNTFLPIFYKNRLNVAFWLVDKPLSKEVSKPPLPIDCLKANKFLHTLQGCVSWYESFPIAFAVNFKVYLTEMLNCMHTVVPVSTLQTQDTHSQVEEMVKILSLL
ncbi:ORF40 [Felid gammaherpesvirus 1]|uniref:ORF40 n=1 Tax=Felid gammaherpesvirus 1 TaxID=2560468 RepID=A0A0M3T965_9GAMA|nr:ORF40 [Felis catus gammaherpesvirus 1]ALE14752.1 ORF40 [Felis catus gammaherpesvirus 1]